MYWQKINYYGFEKHLFDDCKELIHTTNYRHLLLINSWILFMTITSMVLCLFNKFTLSKINIRIFYALMIASLLLEIILLVLKKLCTRYSTVFVHITFLIMIFLGIYSSITQPVIASTVFIVFMMLASVMFIDRMVRFTVLLILYCSIYLYTSLYYKSPSAAYIDMYNTAIFLVLSIVLHYTFQHSRILQLHTFQKNIQIQRDIEIRSSFDTLTNLLNRTRFFSIADQIIKESDRLGEHLAVCLIDLDKFNEINDKLGYQIGDKAIQMTSQLIIEELNIDILEKWSFPERAIKSKYNIAGRLGDDKFIMLIRSSKSIENITLMMQSLLNKLNSENIGELNGINASIGITSITPKDNDMDSIYKRADEALYSSKQQGGNRITVN